MGKIVNFVEARAICIIIAAKSARKSFNFGSVGWGLSSFFVIARGKKNNFAYLSTSEEGFSTILMLIKL